MATLPALDRLVASLEKLPGIGPKSARRIAHHLLAAPEFDAAALMAAVAEARARTRECGVCHALTEEDPCSVCADPAREARLLAVVEEAFDVEILERTHEFRGRYHVLGGALAPLRGVGPDDLHVADLLERVEKAPADARVEEVLIATNPNVEGEATALYLARRLKPLGVRVTRLALGLPVGAALEFADEVTLSRSLTGRRDM
ncbi:MAG TPA: recombination mediator RecR [Thermoanaerobaculia bacterium]|nr:recombination mediator RecR [Thermoanaerobaculia bacterium]